MLTSTKKYPKHGRSRWEKPRNPFAIDKVALRRNICREDYYDFIREFWEEVIAEDPVWNWHIKVMAHEFQKLAEQVFSNKPKQYDLITNVPPGSTKSTVFSILSTPWCWSRMPSLRFLNGCFSGDLSLDLGNKARRVVKSDLYRETFPNIEISSDQDTKGYFSNTLKGERRATSTGADIVGRHAHIIGVDDPINPTGARSPADIIMANNWMTETLPSRCVSQSLTPIFIVMQRLAIDDPTGSRLERDAGVPVRHICLPAEISDNVKPRILRNKYKEGLLDPVRLPRSVLQTKRAELGNFGYSGQFEQRPVPLSGGMFQTNKIQILTPPPYAEFSYVIRWWDKAATSEGSGAYTSGVLMGIRLKATEVPRFWVLDVIRDRWDTFTRERMIRQTAEADAVIWKRKYIVGLEQEPGSGGKDSMLSTTWNLAGFKVISERATGDKFERADPYSVQVNAGNVALAPGIWNKPYLEEMKYFGPTCKYMDQMDASSGAFNKLARRRIKAGSAGF